jgi:hypothetical protein
LHTYGFMREAQQTHKEKLIKTTEISETGKALITGLLNGKHLNSTWTQRLKLSDIG